MEDIGGQGLVEYGMILLLVMVACVSGLTMLGEAAKALFNSIKIP